MKRRQKIREPLDLAQARFAVQVPIKEPFRGEIWDFYKGVPMGRGYTNDNRPFDIGTACYLREPMRRIRQMPYGSVVLLAAVQTLKTAFVEMCMGHFLANDPGDMTAYFLGEDAAIDQAKTRTLNFLKRQPQIAAIVKDVIEAGPYGRFDVTTDQFFLPSMTLRMWPLNEASAQRISLRYVFISDAFLSKRTGLIYEAMARTTAHNSSEIRDYKIIIESQGSEAGDDFDKMWQASNQALLHVRCPFCNTRQLFDWHKQRDETFMPVPPSAIPSLDHAAWIETNRPLLISPDRKHAGMKRGDGVKLADGSYDRREILRQTYYECFHCGSAWRDEPKMRLIVDQSSEYVQQNPTALPYDLGFWWPAWCGQRLRWGEIMLEYLQAKRAAAQGQIGDLKQWYQKRHARAFDESLTRPVIEVVVGSYDPDKAMPDEVCRNMAVDCQQDQEHMDRTGKSITGWFWYIVRACDKFGNSRQLTRGFCKSWEALESIRSKWGVPLERFCIDVQHWTEVTDRAAAMAKAGKPLPPFNLPRFESWYLMAGDKEERFRHKDGKYRPFSPPQLVMGSTRDAATGRLRNVALKKIRWSNLAFKLQLDAIRSGVAGMPKFEILDRAKLDDLSQSMEQGIKTYRQQMDNEFCESKAGKMVYTPVASRTDVHYRDCECMLLVRQAMDGMLESLSVENA